MAGRYRHIAVEMSLKSPSVILMVLLLSICTHYKNNRVFSMFCIFIFKSVVKPFT